MSSLFHYRLSPETFGYTLVLSEISPKIYVDHKVMWDLRRIKINETLTRNRLCDLNGVMLT